METKWCTGCKRRHLVDAFGKDQSRSDGLAATCRKARSTGRPVGWHGKPNVNPLTGKPGPTPKTIESVDGDNQQARQLINREIRLGRRPHPNTLPCVDCGHVWHEGERRHEYDHHCGYDADNHLIVEVVCTKCHAARHRNWEGRKRDSKGRWC